jgi:translation elongation factor EF-Tu-like GTPase
MDENFISVRALVRMVRTEEGGRSGPLIGGLSYRPNHNFFGPESRCLRMGEIAVPEGLEIDPGGEFECQIKFIVWSAILPMITPGREWRIQEGGKLVGKGTVIEVL